MARQLDELDEKILKLIISNARLPFLEVARECNVSGAAIHQRIQKLTNLGVIKGSEFIIDNTKIGYQTCAYIGLFLHSPGQFASVTEALKKIPEVVECHYTTGQYDLFIKIYAKNNQHLLNIIHRKLQPLGLARTESLISFKEAFKKQIPVDFDEDFDDDPFQTLQEATACQDTEEALPTNTTENKERKNSRKRKKYL